MLRFSSARALEFDVICGFETDSIVVSFGDIRQRDKPDEAIDMMANQIIKGKVFFKLMDYFLLSFAIILGIKNFT
jgi:hypothetical protein